MPVADTSGSFSFNWNNFRRGSYQRSVLSMIPSFYLLHVRTVQLLLSLAQYQRRSLRQLSMTIYFSGQPLPSLPARLASLELAPHSSLSVPRHRLGMMTMISATE